jgi:hypothetical protein
MIASKRMGEWETPPAIVPHWTLDTCDWSVGADFIGGGTTISGRGQLLLTGKTGKTANVV